MACVSNKLGLDTSSIWCIYSAVVAVQVNLTCTTIYMPLTTVGLNSITKMQWVLDAKREMLLLNITVVALCDFPFSL